MGPDWIKIRVDDNLGATRKMSPDTYQAVISRARYVPTLTREVPPGYGTASGRHTCAQYRGTSTTSRSTACVSGSSRTSSSWTPRCGGSRVSCTATRCTKTQVSALHALLWAGVLYGPGQGRRYEATTLSLRTDWLLKRWIEILGERTEPESREALGALARNATVEGWYEELSGAQDMVCPPQSPRSGGQTRL